MLYRRRAERASTEPVDNEWLMILVAAAFIIIAVGLAAYVAISM